MKTAMEMIEEIVGPLGGKPRSKLNGHTRAASGVTRPYVSNLSDQQILEKAFAAKNGDRLKKLLDGDISEYPSGSEADLACAGALGFWFQLNAEKIESVMRDSQLVREKWDTLRPIKGAPGKRQTLLQQTIRFALANKTNYHGDDQRPDMSEPAPVVRDAKAPTTKKPTKQGKNAPTQAAQSDAKHTNFLLGPEKSRASDKELFGVPYETPLIVEGFLMQDADGFSSPGGLGKTTLMLWELAHIITGRLLYGHAIRRSGPVLIISAEDSVKDMRSRMNKICRALNLTKKERELVRLNFYSEDVCEQVSARLVAASPRDGVAPTSFIDEIIAKYRHLGLVVTVFDPASLLGPGETSGNDGMSELMRAARRICRRLGCAVRIIHHVSQAVARGNVRDQYAPRGGTAFTDNSRQNHQLSVMSLAEQKSFEHEDVTYDIQKSIATEDFIMRRVFMLNLHKISYYERDPTPIVLVRHGFTFEQIPITRRDVSPQAEANRRETNMEKVIDHVRYKAIDGIKLSKSDMDGQSHLDALGLTRKEMRDALHVALGMHALEEIKFPKEEHRSGPAKYLKVA